MGADEYERECASVSRSYAEATGREDRKRASVRQRKAVPQGTVSAEDLDGGTLLKCLYSVHAAGGALRIGHTRDHGAWAFGIYGDGAAPYTEYVRPGEDVNEYLRGLGSFFEAMMEQP